MCLGDYRPLAKALGTPPMFTDVLFLIVKPDEVDLLLRLSEKEQSIAELSDKLGLRQDAVDAKLTELFRRGFLKKRTGNAVYYSVKPFQAIVNRHLSEGRRSDLGKYAAALAQTRMEDHVKRANADAHPMGKVLPIPEAVVEPVSIILPYETAVTVLEKAKSFSLRDCECRITYKQCDRPLRTCLGLDEFSDELVERGAAESISLEEAKKVLHLANENGLVHQVLYTDWLKGDVFDLCSCCPCCCQYLRTLMDYGVKHHVAKSGLVAKVDPGKCSGCGKCVERCVFHARKLEKGKSRVVTENCYGCGLCTTTCSTAATRLVSTNLSSDRI